MPPCTHPSLRYSDDYPKGTKCASCGEPAESVLSSVRGQLATAQQALGKAITHATELEERERQTQDARVELEALRRSAGAELEPLKRDLEDLRTWKVEAIKKNEGREIQISALAEENIRLVNASKAADRAREEMRARLAPQENNEALIGELRGKVAVSREALGKIKGGWVDRDYPKSVAKEALALLDEVPAGKGEAHAGRG